MKYLLRGWSTMTPFIPFLIVTSLYEVFIERLERTPSPGKILQPVKSQRPEVWKVSSYSVQSIDISYSEITMRIGLKGVIVLQMEYDDTFHTCAHCDLIV
jgi:hypothetical protein